MRLPPRQIIQIRQSAAETFGPDARIRLFSSRVDGHTTCLPLLKASA